VSGWFRTARVASGLRVRGNGAVVLAYHDVRTTGEGYHVSATQLARHVELLRSSGLRIVDLATIVDALVAGAGVADLAAVTFDDALVGVVENALPVLARHDVPATVFAVADRLGVEPDWTTGERRTLTPAELQQLARTARLTIGCHAGTHRSLVTLDDTALQEELAGARDELQSITGHAVDFLAYPFGHHDGRVRDAARAAGFRAAFTFLNGRVEVGQDPFRLPRLTMGARHNRLRLARHLARPAATWPDTQLDAVDESAGAAP
jgi:peptidoglycan/xylan/chitin deacetylase (PgdA/CDA1 family)